MLDILYEDQSICVVKKPAGVDAQSNKSFQPDMVSLLQNHLADQLRRSGKAVTKAPYVGVIHRLDKPVSGVMVYAKSPQAAAALSAGMQKSTFHKEYYALICGKPEKENALLEDYLLQDRKSNTSQPVSPETKGAKLARLEYHVIKSDSDEWEKVMTALGWSRFFFEETQEPMSLVRICLMTGRHHQIRVQMAAAGFPLYGDARYQNPAHRIGKTLALCAWRLEFEHPVSGKRMDFSLF